MLAEARGAIAAIDVGLKAGLEAALPPTLRPSLRVMVGMPLDWLKLARMANSVDMANVERIPYSTVDADEESSTVAP